MSLKTSKICKCTPFSLSVSFFSLFLLSHKNGRRFLSLASPLSVPRSRRDGQFLQPKLCWSKRWNLEVRVFFSLELAVLWNFTIWIAVSFFISIKKALNPRKSQYWFSSYLVLKTDYLSSFMYYMGSAKVVGSNWGHIEGIYFEQNLINMNNFNNFETFKMDN